MGEQKNLSEELKGDRGPDSTSTSKELAGGKELQGEHLGGADVRQGDRDGHLRQRPRQEEGDEGDEGDQRDGGEQARDWQGPWLTLIDRQNPTTSNTIMNMA